MDGPSIPDSESWLHEPEQRERLNRALAAHASEQPGESPDLERLAEQLGLSAGKSALPPPLA